MIRHRIRMDEFTQDHKGLKSRGESSHADPDERPAVDAPTKRKRMNTGFSGKCALGDLAAALPSRCPRVDTPVGLLTSARRTEPTRLSPGASAGLQSFTPQVCGEGSKS